MNHNTDEINETDKISETIIVKDQKVIKIVIEKII